MQTLTLKSFLSEYVQYLSGLETNSIKRLAEAAQTNYRLREPLFLYAYCTDKADLLLDSIKDSELRDRYSYIRVNFSFPEMLAALESKSSKLDERYHKCYNSYICRRDMPKTYNRKKQLMLNKIKELQSTKRVTVYRIYTDLNLNGSNINAFIKHGKVEKVSLDVVRKMLQYLEDL